MKAAVTTTRPKVTITVTVVRPVTAAVTRS